MKRTPEKRVSDTGEDSLEERGTENQEIKSEVLEESLDVVIDNTKNAIESGRDKVIDEGQKIDSILEDNSSDEAQTIREDSHNNVAEAEEDASTINDEILDSVEKKNEIIEDKMISTEIEEEIIADQKKNEEKREERRKNWTENVKDKEKEKVINSKVVETKETLGERLAIENKNLIDEENLSESGQKDVKKILESYDQIKKIRDGLKEEVDQNMEAKDALSKGIIEQLNLNQVDLSSLGNDEIDVIKNTTDRIIKTTKDTLSINEINYLMETMGNVDNFGDLKNTHEDRQIEIEKLQEIIQAMEQYQMFLEKFAKLEKDERKEQQQTVRNEVEKLESIYTHDKKLYGVLLALGVVGALALLCSSTGVALPAFMTFRNLTIAGGVVSALGTLAELRGQDELIPLMKYTGKVAAITAGLPILGAGMFADWIFNGEKIGKFFDWAAGTPLPSWAQDKSK